MSVKKIIFQKTFFLYWEYWNLLLNEKEVIRKSLGKNPTNIYRSRGVFAFCAAKFNSFYFHIPYKLGGWYISENWQLFYYFIVYSLLFRANWLLKYVGNSIINVFSVVTGKWLYPRNTINTLIHQNHRTPPKMANSVCSIFILSLHWVRSR